MLFSICSKNFMKKLYVGNLAYSVTEDELRELFGTYGEVSEVNIIKDRETGQSKGFGFVDRPLHERFLHIITGLEIQHHGFLGQGFPTLLFSQQTNAAPGIVYKV